MLLLIIFVKKQSMCSLAIESVIEQKLQEIGGSFIIQSFMLGCSFSDVK